MKCTKCGIDDNLRNGLCSSCFSDYQEALDDVTEQVAWEQFSNRYNVKIEDMK